MGKRLDFTACPFPPKAHQVTAIEKIVDEPYVFLTDEMGMMKTKTVIDSASMLYSQGMIDRVLVVTTAATRDNWADIELGQLVTHCWPTLSNYINVCGTRSHSYHWGDVRAKKNDPELEWIITNYEWLRYGLRSRSRFITARLKRFMDQCDTRTLLVLDESTAVKNPTAKQTRACMWLRKRSGRAVLMTGTPIAHSPVDLLSQANLLHPSILSDRPGEYLNLLQFRSRYCVMGGYQGRKVLSFHHLEDLQARLKPHTLRRLKKDCLDLPEKLDPVIHTVTLTPESWRLYTEMRNHAIVQLASGDVSIAKQAVVKLIRLSQLTSGHLGGVGEKPQETGSEKIDALVAWVSERLEEDPTYKLVVWSQFRADVARLAEALKPLPIEIGLLWGQTSTGEREHALRLLHPQTAPKGAAVVLGTPQTGAFGITLAAAPNVIYLSNSYSLNIRQQSEDRNHRPGQTRAVSYFDFIAEGPRGQRTIDHLVLKALRKKKSLADWTASAWLEALKVQRTD